MWLLCSLAFADLIPEAPDGQIHVEHRLKLEGVNAHKDVVLVAMEDGADGALHAYRAFGSGTTEHQLANGAARDSGMGTATLYAMSKEDFEVWEKATSEDIEKQRELCYEGIGCDHISRFSPTMKAPEKRASCETTIRTQTSAPKGSPTVRMDVYKVVEATASSCRLEPVSVEPLSAPASVGGCSAVGLASTGLGALLLLLGVRRRQVPE